MFTYFTQESYFIFREGVVVVILLAVNRVYGLCVYVHCCVYTHTHVGKILFPIFLKDILYPAPKNTLFRNWYFSVSLCLYVYNIIYINIISVFTGNWSFGKLSF